MGRYAFTAEPDAAAQEVGDAAFVGVNDASDARLLDEGLVAAAVNKSFRDGRAATRGGMVAAHWASGNGLAWPIDFPFDFARMGMGAPLGFGVFSDPNGSEAALIATRSGVWRCLHGSEPELIRLPGGAFIEGPVTFAQAFDRVLMFRGPDQVPLEWSPAMAMDDGLPAWHEIDQSETGDYTEPIPNAERALLFANRLWIGVGRDLVAVSEILDYTRYDSALSVFRINAGSDDRLVALAPWTQGALLALCTQSVHVLTGLNTADLAESAAQTLITDQFGLIGPNAWARVGNDVWFLSEGGIRSIGLTAENATQAQAAPISAPIERTIARINWPAAARACAAAFEDRVFFAVPLDNAEHNNALLVYNLATRQWEGYWTAPWMDVRAFVATDDGGRRRLLIGNGGSGSEWRATGGLMTLDGDWLDDLYGFTVEIEDLLLTRAYRPFAPGDESRTRMLKLVQATWRPLFDVDVLRDGPNERRIVTSGITYDATRYYQFGVPDYDPTNVLDDHARPHRYDYAVDLLSTPLWLGNQGLDPDTHQRHLRRWSLRARGEFVQIEVRNRQGRAVQESISIEAVPGRRAMRRMG